MWPLTLAIVTQAGKVRFAAWVSANHARMVYAPPPMFACVSMDGRAPTVRTLSVTRPVSMAIPLHLMCADAIWAGLASSVMFHIAPRVAALGTV